MNQNHPLSQGITNSIQSLHVELSRKAEAMPPMSEIEREGNALTDSMLALDKIIAQLSSRLSPVLADPHPIGSGSDTKQLLPLSDVGRLLRTRTEHVNEMGEAVNNLISRLAV